MNFLRSSLDQSTDFSSSSSAAAVARNNNDINSVSSATTNTNGRLNQSKTFYGSSTKLAASNGNHKMPSFNCILPNYPPPNSLLMKNSCSGSERDSMSDVDSDDEESDVDIMGDSGMLC